MGISELRTKKIPSELKQKGGFKYTPILPMAEERSMICQFLLFLRRIQLSSRAHDLVWFQPALTNAGSDTKGLLDVLVEIHE